MTSDESPALPLQGIRVLDLSRVIAGPNCTMHLADLGAEVIKIEHPLTGDDTRQMKPPEQGGESAFFLAYNRNKRSVALDLKAPRGLAVLRQLVAKSDVFIENFRPGVTARMGLDYGTLRALKPNLVYCSVSAYGQDGSMSSRPGFDPVLQAEMGLMSINGEADGDPLRHPLSLTDLHASLLASTGICAALVRRGTTGEGEHLDLSLMGAAISMVGNMGTYTLSTGANPPRMGNGFPTASPVGAFRGSDGEAFYLACATDRLFRRLAEDALDRPDLAEDPRFSTSVGRVRHREALLDELKGVFAQHPRAVWMQRLGDAGLPAGPVRSITEALASAEVREAGLVQALEHPTAGTVSILGSPLKLRNTPKPQDTAPPVLGQHTTQVLRDVLQVDDASLQSMLDDGVVVQWDQNN